ncbi:MAG: hypothetical protein K2L86_01830 [Lachnospiraceae bacterium]|nr:hypothetical protein [Lachnospiraceae bacterium]
MLGALIQNAQENSEEDMLALIEKFNPLMVKYARKLNYEDAYNDIVLCFINLIKSQNLRNLTDKADNVIVTYINHSIINYYNKKIPKLISQKNEVVMSDLSEEQQYIIEAVTAHENETDIVNEYGLANLLTEGEQQLIYQVYVEGHTIAELARYQNRTRQAVNQQRIRAVNKIRTCLI